MPQPASQVSDGEYRNDLLVAASRIDIAAPAQHERARKRPSAGYSNDARLTRP
jgi:hypothetical protein